MKTRARLVLLLACTATGLAVGALGAWLGGSNAWFLAVPAIVAVAWLFVADPTACAAPAEGDGDRPRRRGPAADPTLRRSAHDR